MGAQEVKEFFQKTFGAPPAQTVRAPGRLELLGNHTDYNGGLVMALAVDKYIYIAASPRKDGQIELASTSFNGREIFYIDKIAKNPAALSHCSRNSLYSPAERSCFTAESATTTATPAGIGSCCTVWCSQSIWITWPLFPNIEDIWSNNPQFTPTN